jgi:hypothetical protein
MRSKSCCHKRAVSLCLKGYCLSMFWAFLRLLLHSPPRAMAGSTQGSGARFAAPQSAWACNIAPRLRILLFCASLEKKFCAADNGGRDLGLTRELRTY